MGRRFQTVFVALMTASALFVGTSAAPVEPVGTQSYIVVLQEGTGNVPEVAADLARAHGGEVGFVYEHAIQGFSVTISPQGAAALARNPRVAYVNEDRPVWAFEDSVPTGVSRIEAPAAHTKGATGLDANGNAIRVAIIDTGIDSNHPDLVDNLQFFRDGIDCINGGDWAEDDQGHGTHVAGTVAAVDNDQGVIGVAPDAQLIPIKVLGSNGSGTTSQVVCGIDHVTALNTDNTDTNDIHVANMSLGGSGTHDGEQCSNIVKEGRGTVTQDAEYEAICFAIASGATFVVAAGNDATNASSFVPAAYPEVITVSAYSDTNGSSVDAGCTRRGIFQTCDEVFASFSNYGDIVDVIAPGMNINSTTLGGGYGTKSGTSMAAPHVAGVAALILSQNSAYAPADVETHLRDKGQCPNTKINDGSNTTGECGIDQGTWDGDPDTWTEPMANANFATATSNAAPTASFTYSCTDLACNFNGSGSSDTDGTISSYAWNFGDGATGTGVTASHTYAAGGTYTVTLTVTDNDGATGSESQSVTVTAPSTGVSLRVTAYKEKGLQRADLSWSEATSTNVDIYRDGSLLTTTANDGFHTDQINNRGGGSYTYHVCEAGTSTCSNEATASY